MNFVTKNLGWILLLCFFLFMLFVISFNNGGKNKTETGAVINIASSGTTQEDLDSLVEMIEVDVEDTYEETKQGVSDEVNEITETGATEKKQSLFSRIFSRNNMKKSEDIENLKKNEEISTGATLLESDENNEVENPRENLIGAAGGESVSLDKNVIKKSGKLLSTPNTDAYIYAPEVFSRHTIYPGVNLKTEIGKKFEIGVHSLKLNNKYFNETLAYMMRGDTVQQVTGENSYGCFEVEILMSQSEYNIGKKGYVCKKYLQETSSMNQIEDVVEGEYVAIENPKQEEVVVDTQIGDLIIVERADTLLGEDLLNMGDVIDQFSPADIQGCFIARVYASAVSSNVGKTGKVCVNNLY